MPFTCTVHDLILHRFPNEVSYARRLAYRFVVRSALRNSKHVFTVSEFTKKDIRQYYGASAEKRTTVTYPGASILFSSPTQEAKDAIKMKYRLEKPFLLYVGNCKQHKNVGTLIEAFQRAELSGIELVLIAGGRECAAFGRREDVHYLPMVPREDLPALYAASLGCVTATLLEGFCLPLIEAMACRTPVLATNIGPIPEVCGEHALLVEPSVERISEGMRTLVLDPAVRSSEALTAAERWAARFSWNITASQTASVFKSTLEQIL